MARQVRFWIIPIMFVWLLVACSEKAPSVDGPTATVPTMPTTTNPYAMPTVVDVAYVNRVLAGLDQAMGEVTRLVVGVKSIPPEAIERMEAIFVDDRSNPDSLVMLSIRGFEIGMREHFSGYQTRPGNNVTTVTELISAMPSCIFAKVDQDYSAISNKPPPRVRSHWVGLVPLDPANDPKHYNPTPWVYYVDGVMPDMSQPGNRCAAGS